MGRSRRRGIAAAAVLALAAAALAWAALRPIDDDHSGRAVAFTLDGVEMTATIPPGWHLREDWGDHAFGAWHGAPFVSDEDARRCNGTDFQLVFVTLQPSVGGSVEHMERPERFTSSSGGGFGPGGDDASCELQLQSIHFDDAGHTYVANVTLGRDAGDELLDDAHRILDSVQVVNRS